MEIPKEEILNNKKIEKLLPEIEAEITAIYNVGAGLGDGYGTVDVSVLPDRMKIKNILYNDNGYMIFNYICEIAPSGDWVDSDYKYIDMYAKV